MRKNGFTLIELLAVIVILAIIALIAVPIILGIINTAREESNKRSIELYGRAITNAILTYELVEQKNPKTFSDLTVEYKGDVECAIKELYSDGSFYLEGCRVNKSEKEYSYGTKKVSNKACTLEDKDGDGVASLSDIVICGTESFYVMKNENNEITMLSMYNLYVGNVYNSNTSELISIENPTNKQNEIAKGYIEDSYVFYGTVKFSSRYYWEFDVVENPIYVYNKNADIIYPYVSEYERILREEIKVGSAKTSIISFEQLEELGCNSEKYTCGPDIDWGYGALENPAPEWVYSTSYWTGSIYDTDYVWKVASDGSFNNSIGDGLLLFGVRPVVTISTTEI